MFGERWSLPPWECRREFSPSEIGERVPWGLAMSGIDKLHVRTKGAGVKVAVLDTGIMVDHPDLAGQVIDMKDFSRSVGGAGSDKAGHGTHTAGTIAAIDGNGIGIPGVAPESKLLIGKVLGDDSSGSMDAVAAGIIWAVDGGADVISMSLNGPDADGIVRQALVYAAQKGVLVACAAGNRGQLFDRRSGLEINTVDPPGKWTPLCTCVGAHDENGKIAKFSARGPEVDLLAPGVQVLSCWHDGGYATLDGTSMATPFVAGTIALMIAYRRKNNLPSIRTQAELEVELFKSAIPIGKAAGTGHGLLNPNGLFENMASAPPATIEPTVTPVAPAPIVPAAPSDGKWPPTFTLGPFDASPLGLPYDVQIVGKFKS